MSSPAPRPVAIVTGASSGIGREFARLFGADRWDLVLVARRETALRELASELTERHAVDVHVVPADLADASGPQRVADQVAARGLAIEALVNSAGLGVWGRFAETEWRAERDMLAVNVVALTELTKRILPSMLARRRGRILNVASTAAFQPGPLMAVYFASKAYVLNFSIALEAELERSGVTVTTLCPGPTRSGFADAAGARRSKLFAGGRAMAADEVARAGYDAMLAGRGLIVLGNWNKLLAFTTRLVPRSFAAQVALRMAERAA